MTEPTDIAGNAGPAGEAALARLHQEITSGARSIGQAIAEIAKGVLSDAGVARAVARQQAFAELAIRFHWPPPWHLPIPAIDQLVTYYESKAISDAEVEQLFVDFYSPEMIQRIEQGWLALPWLTHRHEILSEGVSNHSEARYHSAVCTLLPQIEGILGDHLQRRPNAQNDAPKIFRDTRLGNVAREFYIDLYRESVSWNNFSAIPELARNAILHGRATNYGTIKHSLKVILVLDHMISMVPEQRVQSTYTDSERLRTSRLAVLNLDAVTTYLSCMRGSRVVPPLWPHSIR